MLVLEKSGGGGGLPTSVQDGTQVSLPYVP